MRDWVEGPGYEYTIFPKLFSIYSTFGIDRGGTIVNLTGMEFSHPMWCKFGNQIVNATVLDEEHGVCITPPVTTFKFEI